MLPEDEKPDETSEIPEEASGLVVDEDEVQFDEDLEGLADESVDEDRTSVSEGPKAKAEEAPTEEGEPEQKDAEVDKAEEKPEEAAPAEAAEATKVEPEAEPAPVAPTAPEPVQPPVEPPAPPVAVEQPVPQVSAEEAAAAQAKQRENAEGMLAEHYALPKELADGLDPEIAEYIPKLGARIFMDAVSHTLQQVQQMLPTAVNNIANARTHTDTLEDQFFEKWPALREHGEKVQQFGMAYRQVNPTATPEDFMNDVGAQVHVALRIPIAEAAAAQADPVEASPTKFVPAAKSSPRGAPAKQPGMFEQLDEDLFADEPY
jgi:hypothetical protein